MAIVRQTSLDLDRCPHCGVDAPNLPYVGASDAPDYQGTKRLWVFYRCGRCAGIVVAWAANWNIQASQVFPASGLPLSDDIPERARAYLQQAMDSMRSPSGAVMLAASSVDAMLKAANLKTGSLFERINEAAKQHLITPDMAKWAHEVRLDANDQRHAEENAQLPSIDDAKRTIEFAHALAQFMFVLPARVQRGIQSATKQPNAP
jgi:hypothetical protein